MTTTTQGQPEILRTRTTTGVDATIEPRAEDRNGTLVPILRVEFRNPKYGPCSIDVDTFGRIPNPKAPAQEVAHGWGYLGGNYVGRIGISLTREDYDRAMTVARAMVEATSRAAEEETAQRRRKALDACPAGHVLARQKWSNGDLASALYVTEDGTEILASDLLSPVEGGWYFVPAAEVEAKREKTKAATEVREAESKVRAEARAEEEAGAFERAKADGKPVEVRRWTEPCDESVDECSLDVVRLMAHPDGSTSRRRTHTH